ncbi:MAG TPA: class I tRNA ligase family protein, partial [Clostridia bacterium]|nr:class I tRNA ligase family protein [Clostridia bacterium]
KHNDWRNNAIAFTKRYIDEGLRDRAITRDLEWGIKVPKEGYEDKRIYIWAENVLGYLSASKVLCDKRNIPFDDLWKNDSRHYYVHGKDNIPFHTIILPSLLLAHNQGYHLPDDIISNEHLTLEGRKISTSKNWAIWAKDIVKEYSPDTIRFFLVANGPEKRDTDFTWSEFAERNNSELLGIYGNFVNRTLLFIKKYQYNIVPKGIADEEIQKIINDTYANAGKNIENGRLKEALQEVISLVRYGNKYYDTKEPWKTRTSNIEDCDNTIFNCTQIIANAAVLFRPFIPFSSDKVLSWLDLSYDWEIKKVKEGYTLPEISILFERITIPSQPQP